MKTARRSAAEHSWPVCVAVARSTRVFVAPRAKNKIFALSQPGTSTWKVENLKSLGVDLGASWPLNRCSCAVGDAILSLWKAVVGPWHSGTCVQEEF